MRIGIDTVVAPGPYTGVGRQLYGLLGALPQADPESDYRLYTDRRRPLPVNAPNFRSHPLPVSSSGRLRNHLFTALALPLLAERHGLDVLHIPNTMPLLVRRLPTVVTIFDLAEYALSEPVYQRGRHGYRRLANRLAARGADLVITTSASTGRDLVRYLAVEPARIRVIYPGVDHDRFRPQAISPARRAHLSHRYRLPDRFLLYMGKIQPRKNLVRVVRALHQVRRTHPDVHLVLAGTGGWMGREISRTIEELELASAIHLTGFVADADLPAVYSLAEMLVFPSLYEGFGFPVVEAMACGTPVVTAATSSLGEIAGDAALTVDPTSVDHIASAVEACLDGHDLQQALRQKGLARAARYTWARCAVETAACYQALATAAPG